MDEEDNTTSLNACWYLLAIWCKCLSIDILSLNIGPLKALEVNIFISKLPIFKSDLITIFVLHELTLKFSFDLFDGDSVCSVSAEVSCFEILGVSLGEVLTYFVFGISEILTDC